MSDQIPIVRTDPVRLPPGYEFLQVLGAGAMGDVYKALDTNLDRPVAIKMAKPAQGETNVDANLKRLLSEAKTIARLEHPNIVTVYRCDIWEGQVFIVMEFLDGMDLGAILKAKDPKMLPPQFAQTLLRKGVFKPEWSCRIGAETARALYFAHNRHIYHRDIKPSNIFLTNDCRVKVFDFGIARDAKNAGLTQTGILVGTPPYMSPEQIKGEKLDGRSDLYSLGCVLFHGSAGRVPFSDTSEIMVCIAHLEATPPNPIDLSPDLPKPLADVILKCLEKSRDSRYADARELETALIEQLPKDMKVVVGEASPLSPVLPQAPENASGTGSGTGAVRQDAVLPAPARPHSPLMTTVLALAATVLLIVAAGGTWILYREFTKPPAGTAQDENTAPRIEMGTGPDGQPIVLVNGQPATPTPAPTPEPTPIPDPYPPPAEVAAADWVPFRDTALAAYGAGRLMIEGAAPPGRVIRLQRTDSGEPVLGIRLRNLNPFPVRAEGMVAAGNATLSSIDVGGGWIFSQRQVSLAGQRLRPWYQPEESSILVPAATSQPDGASVPGEATVRLATLSQFRLVGSEVRLNLDVTDLRLVTVPADDATTGVIFAGATPEAGSGPLFAPPLGFEPWTFEEDLLSTDDKSELARKVRGILTTQTLANAPGNQLDVLSSEQAVKNFLEFVGKVDDAIKQRRHPPQGALSVVGSSLRDNRPVLRMNYASPDRPVEVWTFIVAGTQTVRLASADESVVVTRDLAGRLDRTELDRFKTEAAFDHVLGRSLWAELNGTSDSRWRVETRATENRVEIKKVLYFVVVPEGTTARLASERNEQPYLQADNVQPVSR